MSAELLARRQRYRRRIKRGLGNIRSLFLTLGPELNFGHPCGTLRFSDDPRRGVLDRQGKAHGLDNLWGADSAFMPTSTGVNPSLTIVANALRVAEGMAVRLKETA
jgi:choline dehydrogenase-like flavoprotein